MPVGMGSLATLAVLLTGYVTHALWIRHLFGGLACDDAFISFRYLDILASHGQLSYNVGERVEGYSNFLWMLLLAPAAFLHLDLSSASQFLGLMCGVATIVTVFWGLDRVFGCTSLWVKAAAGALLVASGHFAA